MPLACCLRGWLPRGQRVIVNMAAQAETTVKRFHSLDGDMALQSEERFRGAEAFARNNNLALQAFTLFEWFLRDAIESFAAEVFGGALNRHLLAAAIDAPANALQPSCVCDQIRPWHDLG